jgi:hypothetical protein
MYDFRKIVFGYASAEAEVSHDPGLLTEGHIDFKAASEQALNGPRYIFLGYKGSGKSHIGERLLLQNEGSYDTFVKLVSLDDFPFTPFGKVIRGDAEPESKYPAAWSWILLIYVLESFARDASVTHPDAVAFQDAVRAFREMGLSPASNPASIVRTTSKNGFKLSLPGKLAEYSWSQSETRPASEIPDFVQSLKELLSHVRSDCRHYLIIDGLDNILTSREVQYKSLSALVFEVARLNDLFRNSSVPVKIILLCRTDLYERIPGPNKNKIRQDYGVELDWYHDVYDPCNSLLVQAAQLRTNRSLKNDVNLFKHFLPSTIDETDPARFLLEMTRHTPRDFLQLFHHIQKFSGSGKLSAQKIKSGLGDYSIKYFLPEIQDELDGYVSRDEMSQIIAAMSRLRKRDFKLPELIHAAKDMSKPLAESRIYEILVALFHCSALGNIQHTPGGKTRYSFKFRNRHSSFIETEQIMLHRGLWKALNVV